MMRTTRIRCLLGWVMGCILLIGWMSVAWADHSAVDAEENLAAEAQREFYQGLTGAEKDYLGIEEDRLRRLFEQYALAQKVYKSVGTSFEERYDSFCTTLDYDLNEKLWNTVALAEIDDLTQTPGFSEVYVKYFGNSDLGADTAVRESSDKNKK